jgi:hypothetical protein
MFFVIVQAHKVQSQCAAKDDKQFGYFVQKTGCVYRDIFAEPSDMSGRDREFNYRYARQQDDRYRPENRDSAAKRDHCFVKSVFGGFCDKVLSQ